MKKKLAFDYELYLKIQKKAITDRITKFDKKLYLEFGGKLFDDLHASRVLPGFPSDAKINLLTSLKDKMEIIIVVNNNDICANKVRNDIGITYEAEVKRLIKSFARLDLSVCGVVMQAVVKNPLADPYVLGISSGASLGATLAILFGIGAVFGAKFVGVMAFLGAVGTSFAVLFISKIVTDLCA